MTPCGDVAAARDGRRISVAGMVLVRCEQSAAQAGPKRLMEMTRVAASADPPGH
jgi:hypothetical protein